MAYETFSRRKFSLLTSTALTKQAAALGALGVVFGANPAFALDPNALPQDPNVVGGGATFNSSGATLTVNQSTNRTVIDWRSFNIGSNATTNFVQPGASSIAVNRVNASANPTEIQGSLNANGQVWILNPNGVLFGKTAKIDVAGIVASTANISVQTFMSGDTRLQLTGGDHGSVTNEGAITVADSGLAAFVAPSVRNSGVIQARVGRVTLAAGSTFTLDLAGDRLVEIGLGANNALVDQSGQILADGSRVNLSAKSASAVVDSIVNVSGTVLASSVSQDGGTIILSADNITTASSAVLKADAGTNGNGGEITSYANKTGNYDGAFSAKGGSASGDGGFIETSGKKVQIANNISVNTLADHGDAGMWTVDPIDLVIGTSEAAAIVSNLNTTNQTFTAENSVSVNAAIDSSGQSSSTTLAFNDENADNNLTVNLNDKITLGTNQHLTGQGTTVNVSSNGLIQNGIDVAKAGGATVNVAAGTYGGTTGVNVNKAGLTLSGAGSDNTIVNVNPGSGELNGFVVTANNVTIEGFQIVGEITGSYINYAFGTGTSRGIFAMNGVTGFNFTNNKLLNLRTGILIDGRNTGSVTNNLIDNTKSAISVQYTDGNEYGYVINISGNSQGTYGNEWGVNYHLNGHWDGNPAHSPVANIGNPIAAAPTLAIQQAMLANSADNDGWWVQDQGYTSSNRTEVLVSTTGSASNQGSPRAALNTIQAGVNAVVTGGKVHVADGTYVVNAANGYNNGYLGISKSLYLIGQSEAGTIIDARGASSYGIRIIGGTDGVSLSDFTLLGVTAAGGYGIKAEDTTNFSVDHVTSHGAYKAQLDMNGVRGGTVDYFTADGTSNGSGTGSTKGAAIAITDSQNVTVSNSHTNDGSYGGLAIYQSNKSGGYSYQVDNITIADSNTFAESTPVYMEDESATNNFGTVNVAGFDYIARNTNAADAYTWFQTTQQGAIDVAAAAAGYVQGWLGSAASNVFTVGYNTGNTIALSINTAINAALAGATINVGEGAYAGTVEINKSITLAGAGMDETQLTGGIHIPNAPAITGLSFKDFTVSGDGGSNTVVRQGNVTNFSMDHVRIDGGDVAGRYGFAAGNYSGDISITNSQFVNIRGWSAFDTSTSGTAHALTSVVFTDNLLDNTVGHITFRQSAPNVDVLISGNTVQNVGDTSNLSSGIFKVFGATTVNFLNNNISGIGSNPAKTTAGIADGAALIVSGVDTLNVNGNTFTDNQEAILVGAGNALPTTTNITGNTFTNNAYDIQLAGAVGSGALNFGAGNNFIAGAATQQHLLWGGSSNIDMTNVEFDGKLGSDMTQAELFAVEDLITHGMDSASVGIATVKAGNLYVTTNSGSIQRGIDIAAAGNTVNVADGTYVIASGGGNYLHITKALSLVGQSEAGTIIDASAASTYGIRVQADDVSLSDFTVKGPTSTGGYGIKVEPLAGAIVDPNNRLVDFSIADVTIKDSYKTGLDLNGVNGATIDGVTVTGATHGNGVALTDTANATLTNVSTSGNAWGGLALYQTNNTYNQQVNDISVDASNSFGEANGVYLEDESASLDFGSLTVDGYNYAAHNTDASDAYTWLQTTVSGAADRLQGAGVLASGYVNGWTGSASDNAFHVGHTSGGDAMSINAALANSTAGSTINVGSGAYGEDVVVAGARKIAFNGSTLNSYTQNVASAIGGGVSAVNGFFLNAATTLLSNTTLNGAVTAQSIDGSTAGGQALTINGGSNAVALGNLGATTRLGATNVTGTTSLNGSVYKANALTFNGPATLTQVLTTFDTSASGGNVTFTGNIFGTTDSLQSVAFTTGHGDISLQNAGTNSIWLGSMVVAGDDFSAASVYVNGYVSVLTGNQTFTSTTLNSKGGVNSSVGGNASGPIKSDSNVNIVAGGDFNGNITAPSGSVTGDNITGTFTGNTFTFVASNSVDLTTNANSINVSSPSGTVDGTFSTINNSGGSIVVNGQTRTGNSETNPNQIVVEGYTLPAGAIVTASGEIILPNGLVIGLISPQAGGGAPGSKPKVVVVHSVQKLGELLAQGYVAIIVDLSKNNDDQEELALAD
jgi:filamentous hemagglutinin family protein